MNGQARSRIKVMGLHLVPGDDDVAGGSTVHPPQSTDPDARTEVERLRDEIAGLRFAMQNRALIEQAKGILMGRFGADDDVAFSILRRWSMTANLKLRHLALALIEISANHPTGFTADERAIAAVRAELGAPTSRRLGV